MLAAALQLSSIDTFVNFNELSPPNSDTKSHKQTKKLFYSAVEVKLSMLMLRKSRADVLPSAQQPYCTPPYFPPFFYAKLISTSKHAVLQTLTWRLSKPRPQSNASASSVSFRNAVRTWA
jgi:hypothetical protein